MSADFSLSGKRIVLTRDPAGNARLAAPLMALGAEVVELPLIEVHADYKRDASTEILRDFASYEWLVFTSRNGVRFFMEMFLKAFSDIRSLGFVRIAVVGEGTATALEEFHLRPDLIAPKATAGALAKALAEEQTLDNLKVLVITGNRNSEELVNQLSGERAIVDALQVYATQLRDLSSDKLASAFRERGADVLVFASASAVQAFGEQAANLKLAAGARRPVLCSFGESTSERMRAFKIPVSIEVASPGIQGLVDAIVKHFSQSPQN